MVETIHSLVVAYFVTHNDGIESGVISRAIDHLALADLYECGIELKFCDSEFDANAWITERRRSYENGEG